MILYVNNSIVIKTKHEISVDAKSGKKCTFPGAHEQQDGSLQVETSAKIEQE